jgi:hypothetical protein
MMSCLNIRREEGKEEGVGIGKKRGHKMSKRAGSLGKLKLTSTRDAPERLRTLW